MPGRTVITRVGPSPTGLLFDQTFVSAPGRSGQHFAGAAASGRIEAVANRTHDRQVFRCEQPVHKTDLFNADSVFTSHASTEINTFAQNFIAGLQDLGDLFFVAFIKEQDGMDISIPRVKHIDDSKTVPLAAGDNKLQDFR